MLIIIGNLGDITIPVTVKIENGGEESDFEYRPDKVKINF